MLSRSMLTNRYYTGKRSMSIDCNRTRLARKGGKVLRRSVLGSIQSAEAHMQSTGTYVWCRVRWYAINGRMPRRWPIRDHLRGYPRKERYEVASNRRYGHLKTFDVYVAACRGRGRRRSRMWLVRTPL